MSRLRLDTLQIFATERRTGYRFRVYDMYWFEENHVLSLTEDEDYTFEIYGEPDERPRTD